MTSILLEVDSAAKSFAGRRVLHGAGLWTHAGQVTSLLGRNGCGKTTLLHIATGLLRADGGTVRFKGRHCERPRLDVLARQGLVFLPARQYLPVGHRLRTILAMCAWPAPPDPDLIEELGLGAVLDQEPWQLSGGELRRAEVASVLLRRPACLLLDEPFRGIAPVDCDMLVAILRRFSRDGGGVLVTGHEALYLMAIADSVIWCHDGTTEGVGPPAEAARHFRFREAYLGPAVSA